MDRTKTYGNGVKSIGKTQTIGNGASMRETNALVFDRHSLGLLKILIKMHPKTAKQEVRKLDIPKTN